MHKKIDANINKTPNYNYKIVLTFLRNAKKINTFFQNFFMRAVKYNVLNIYAAIQQVPLSKITVEQQADIENLRNLMFVRSEQSLIDGFDDADID